ncbi:transmembrane and ubiquitin-like domain-containing protein 1 [Paroedura picta]|uniref:transmembrane and ubiquitin-like domain-containing protein 1 n=1 Tax=Paroedura picta TaxID=143630 RepID=UPI004056BB7B
MTLIEGVGDEVTVLFSLLVVLLVLVLAWFSTHTVERGDPALAVTPPLAPGQAGGEGLQEDRPSGQAAGAHSVKEGEPAQGATQEGPGHPSGDVRHRTSLGFPEQPASPRGGTGAQNFPADDTIILRLKFLNDTERLARVHPEDTVGGFKRTHFPGQEQLVRLIYQGQLLRDDSQTLSALHLTHNSVLHCHILQHRSPSLSNNAHVNATHVDPAHTALNVGSMMVPLFLLMLGTLWYFQMQYRHVFTATATTCLAGLTLVFSFVAFAVYRR